VIVTWLLLMLTLAVAAVAADRWAVYETLDGKTRIWRLGVTDGYPGAIKKTEGECSAMLQLAQWSHADEVARATGLGPRVDGSRLERGQSTSAGHTDEDAHCPEDPAVSTLARPETRRPAVRRRTFARREPANATSSQSVCGTNDNCLSNVLVGYALLWEVRHAPTGEPG
jgi:hypothetical protein